MQLEKEILAFASMLQAHLARLVEEAAPALRKFDRPTQTRLIAESVAELWTTRGAFDPLKQTLAQFFGAIVRQAAKATRAIGGYRVASTEEQHVLAALGLGREPAPVVKVGPGTWTVCHTPIEAPQEAGKECPPCWRCRYFDGWLPTRQLYSRDYADAEITAACAAIDKRKVEIAHMVRGTYPAELLEDTDVQV